MFSKHALFKFMPLYLSAFLIVAGLVFWVSGADYTIQLWVAAQDTQPKNSFWRTISLLGLGKIQMLFCFGLLFVLMRKTMSIKTFTFQLTKNIILTYFYFFIGKAKVPNILKNYPLKVQQLFMTIPLMMFIGTLGAFLKVVIGRPRPKMFLWHEDTTMHWFAGFSGKFQSMPSGHTLTTFVLISALWAYFPKLRIPLAFYGIISAIARIMSMTPHYTSDVLVGAGLGILGTYYFSQQYNKRKF